MTTFTEQLSGDRTKNPIFWSMSLIHYTIHYTWKTQRKQAKAEAQ